MVVHNLSELRLKIKPKDTGYGSGTGPGEKSTNIKTSHPWSDVAAGTQSASLILLWDFSFMHCILFWLQKHTSPFSSGSTQPTPGVSEPCWWVLSVLSQERHIGTDLKCQAMWPMLSQCSVSWPCHAPRLLEPLRGIKWLLFRWFCFWLQSQTEHEEPLWLYQHALCNYFNKLKSLELLACELIAKSRGETEQQLSGVFNKVDVACSFWRKSLLEQNPQRPWS